MRHPPKSVGPSTSSRRAIAPSVLPKRVDTEKGKPRKLTDAEIKSAAAKGKKIVAYDPDQLYAVMQGHLTLGEVEGISKKEQYRMAEVGYRFLTEGKLQKGKDVFFGLVALDPYDAYFVTCLASAHQQGGDVKEAERLYSRALAINPFQTTARAHRGELYAMSGRLSDAVADLARAMRDDPQGKDPAVRRAAVLLRAIEVQLKAA